MVRTAALSLLLCAACGDGTTELIRVGGQGFGTEPELPVAVAPVSPVFTRGETIAYPLVLAHGFSGFHAIGSYAYFYGVRDALQREGHAVFAPTVDAFNSSEARGAKLLEHVRQILRETGAEKVNLVCHSQGGLDCRFVANQAPQLVANVLTVATPHRGSPVADIALQRLPGPVQSAVQALLESVGLFIGNGATGDAQAASDQLSSLGAAAFSAKFPNAPGVRYFSIAGASGKSLDDVACSPELREDWVERWQRDSDTLDLNLRLPGRLIDDSATDSPLHDGLVPVSSSKWGTFLGCIPADHFDEICQLANDSPGGANGFSCLDLYRSVATFLGKQR